MPATTTPNDAAPFATPELKAKADAKRTPKQKDATPKASRRAPAKRSAAKRPQAGRVYATPNIDRNPNPKVTGTSKSERARSLFEQGYTVLEVGRLLPDVGWSYAWDIHRAWVRAKEKESAYDRIDGVTPPRPKKAPRTPRKSGMPRDGKDEVK